MNSQTETLPEGAEDPDSKILIPGEGDPIAKAITPAGLSLAAEIAKFGKRYKGPNGEFDLDRYLEDLEKAESDD